jgi:hypothetical protein
VSLTIISAISLVGHRDALHQISVDELARRWQESRRVDVTSDQAIDIRKRLLLDRDDALRAGCARVAAQRRSCTLKRRFGELLI